MSSSSRPVANCVDSPMSQNRTVTKRRSPLIPTTGGLSFFSLRAWNLRGRRKQSPTVAHPQSERLEARCTQGGPAGLDQPARQNRTIIIAR